MSHAFYSEIRLHLTWHTGENRPVLVPAVEQVVHEAIRRKALSYRGVLVHAIGGTEDHVHVAVSIPPNVLVSEFVGQLKGYSSHIVNQTITGPEKFQWQVGYGVVSFGTSNLPWVVNYIEKQKEHHARGKIFDRLERSVTEEDSLDEDTAGSGETAKPPEGG